MKTVYLGVKLPVSGFMISRDLISEKGYKRTGKKYNNYKGGQHKYRLLDDDGQVYFHLLSDIDPHGEDHTEETIFLPLDHFGVLYGVTDLQYYEQTKKKWVSL